MPAPQNSVQWNRFLDQLFDLAAPYLAVRADMDHTRVAHRFSQMLLEREGGDPRVVEPAVILHDVGWSAVAPEQITLAFGVKRSGPESDRLNRIHEVEGAVIAKGILESVDYDPSLIETIVTIIERHDSGTDPTSLEEKVIKDSDRLWRCSKFGFWQELDRQGGLKPQTYHDFVGGRLETWYFTPTAARLAREEWAKRGDEIARGEAPA